jgi:hypothetical protein
MAQGGIQTIVHASMKVADRRLGEDHKDKAARPSAAANTGLDDPHVRGALRRYLAAKRTSRAAVPIRGLPTNQPSGSAKPIAFPGTYLVKLPARVTSPHQRDGPPLVFTCLVSGCGVALCLKSAPERTVG